MRYLILLGFLTTFATANPNAFIRTADQWMQSLEAKKRQAAYRSWLQLGEESMPLYEQALRRSQRHHQKTFDDLVSDERNNPYVAHDSVYEELKTERSRVIPLIRTDWKKDPKKVKELSEEMEDLGKLTEKLAKAAKVETGAFDGRVESHLAALLEIERELNRFEEETEESDVSDDSLKEEIAEDLSNFSDLEEQREHLQQSRKLFQQHADVAANHSQLGGWADDSIKDFAEVLNRNRLALGLGPLELDENLSKASEGHSEDMAEGGFFAHESPVEGKKNPNDRAKLTLFSGRFTGENIFMGSANHLAAYHAWFGSDGHRFGMFADSPNTLGVGVSGIYWTMMTGKR